MYRPWRKRCRDARREFLTWRRWQDLAKHDLGLRKSKPGGRWLAPDNPPDVRIMNTNFHPLCTKFRYRIPNLSHARQAITKTIIFERRDCPLLIRAANRPQWANVLLRLLSLINANITSFHNFLKAPAPFLILTLSRVERITRLIRWTWFDMVDGNCAILVSITISQFVIYQ